MVMTELVLREDRDGWALLTLNRPDKLNALTVAMFRELRDHIADLRKDDSIGCVVLRGAGKCFSAGHDLADIAEGEAVPSSGWHSETLRMLEKLPKPVIAAVHGHCYTGALEVALASKIIANSGFSHAANKRLLEATDGGPLDAGLQWEVMETEGHGPDMEERIGAFMGKGK